MDKYVSIRCKSGHPRNIPNTFTTKQLSIPPNPKTYSMIEKLKTTPTKIILYDLISISKIHREILYALLKKR